MGAAGNSFSVPYFKNLPEPYTLVCPYPQDNHHCVNLLYLYLYALLLEVETIQIILPPYIVQKKHRKEGHCRFLDLQLFYFGINSREILDSIIFIFFIFIRKCTTTKSQNQIISEYHLPRRGHLECSRLLLTLHFSFFLLIQLRFLVYSFFFLTLVLVMLYPLAQ